MIKKNFVLGGIISLFAVIGLSAISAQPASAMGIIHCAGPNASIYGTGINRDAGVRQIDPIVSRGSQMSMHEHQFFGFTEWDTLAQPYSANYQDLVGKKTSCDVPGDSAAYWAPTLRYTGPAKALVKIQRQEAYYRSWDGKLTDPARATISFPADIRMVAGNPNAMSRKDWKPSVVAWSCGNLSTKAQRTGTNTSSPIEANCSTARNYNNPNKNDRVFLTVAVKYPTCWDGQLNDHTVNGDTTDFNGGSGVSTVQHVAYRTSAGCPAGFPNKLPELTIVTSWDYRGTGKNIRLSSGMGMAAGQGYTYHTDFWNTWVPETLSDMVSTCINTNETDQSVHVNHPEICGPPVIMTPPGA